MSIFFLLRVFLYLQLLEYDMHYIKKKFQYDITFKKTTEHGNVNDIERLALRSKN